MNYAAIGAQAAPGDGAPVPLAFPWTAGAVLSLSWGLMPEVGVHSKTWSLAGSAARQDMAPPGTVW